IRKDACLPQRSLKHAAPFITCVIYTVLKNICQVSGCIATSVLLQYTSLSVSIVSMHATFMTFIIHTYLHHLCILTFFNNHLFRIYLSSKRKKKRKKKKKKETSMGASSLQIDCHP